MGVPVEQSVAANFFATHVVTLECLDRSGKTVNSLVLADLFGRRNWQPISKRSSWPRACRPPASTSG